MTGFQKFINSVLNSFRSVGPIYTWVTVWIIFGNVLGLFVINHFSPTGNIDFGQVAIWALAIFLLGAVIGILFGVPKNVSSPVTNVVTQMNAGTLEQGNSSLKSSTTNLTEISDWLTKIVLGAGLVQLKEMPHFILKVADKMALGVSLKSSYYSTSLCAAVIIYYLCFGLLCGYFAMRTIFTEIFNSQEAKAQ
ncbi:hypothetical protein JN11_03367 [Mucilaginibacter frigoritolerans]|uniref:Uncharacterized protein n=1 Tax=Mucilaginibacter frigoritolerans TaxID=652788 RepID=A0A562TVH3_9SPHI|nr:hypothetical protein [Mucilaginibacter frigoritolerans]TWI97547.1 hypothetical protein JN11_03367 [Mucilaginibacter frigoritolerans]